MNSLLFREDGPMHLHLKDLTHPYKFLKMCWQCKCDLFRLFRHNLLVSLLLSSADLTVVKVLQPSSLSHPSLVFGTCADDYPSIKDVRQENVVDLMLR